MPGRAALPRTASTTAARWCGTTRSASCGAARTMYLPRALARLTGMTQQRLRELRARRLRQGRRVPAPRARAPARRRSASTGRCPTTARDEINPPPARFTVELLEHAIRAAVDDVSRAAAGRARRRPRALGRASSTCARSTRRERGAGRRLPGQVRDQEHRTGRRRPAPRHRTRSRPLPVREHVRAYLREAFALAADPALADRRARGRARTRSATAATA